MEEKVLMKSPGQMLSLTFMVFALSTTSNSASSESLVLLAFSSILATSLDSNEGREIVIYDLGPPPDRAENIDPRLNEVVFSLYDSGGNRLIAMPAQTLLKNGFVYLRLDASTCEMGMATCALTITDGSRNVQTINLEPLGDRVVVRPRAECKGNCDRRIMVQQNLLGPDGSTVDIKGHIDHGKTTLTAAITRID
jgi:hypothetical protein